MRIITQEELKEILEKHAKWLRVDKSNELLDKSNELWAEADKVWADGILKIHGNIKIEWKYVNEKDDSRCTLETGEVFKP